MGEKISILMLNATSPLTPAGMFLTRKKELPLSCLMGMLFERAAMSGVEEVLLVVRSKSQPVRTRANPVMSSGPWVSTLAPFKHRCAVLIQLQ